MVDPTTVNRTLAVPTRGTDPGTWDVPVNGNMTILDTALGALTSIAVTTGTVTLTPTQYANGTIFVTGTLSGSVNLVFPAVSGWWSIYNNAINSGGTGAGVFASTSGGTNLIGLPPGSQTDIQVSGTSGVFYRNLGPIGSYLDLAQSNIPLWISASTAKPYLLCDGTSFSGGTYPILADILGGTTLPDLRGRSRFYLDGGTGRITTAISGVNGNAILSAGGAQYTQITSGGQLPNVTFPVSGISLSLSNGGVTATPLKANGASSGPGSSSAVGSADAGTSSVLNTPALSITINSMGSAASGGLSNTIPSMNPATISGLCLIRAG